MFFALPLAFRDPASREAWYDGYVQTEEYPDLAPGGVVLYDGEDVFWLADRVLAVPWGRVV